MKMARRSSGWDRVGNVGSYLPVKTHRFLATLFSLPVVLFPSLVRAQGKPNPYLAWPHSGAFTIVTTPEGANIPAGVVVEGFPLLVRLGGDCFNFKQAKAGGEDSRFSTKDGAALAYEIEEWDAVKGAASVWVRVPRIAGNARQAIRVHLDELLGHANGAR